MLRQVREPGPGQFRGEGEWVDFDGTDEDWGELVHTGYLPTRVMPEKPWYVNLRGPSGSGKTTLARKVLEHKVGEVRGEPYVNRFGAKRDGWPLHICATPVGQVIVHGRYDVQQGGCDTEKDMDIVEKGIEWGIAQFPGSHHLFEGIMISKAKSRWFNFIDRVPGNWRWAWMTTEPEECVKRIMQRNGGRQIVEKEVHSGHRTMMGQYREIYQGMLKGIDAIKIGTEDDVWKLFK